MKTNKDSTAEIIVVQNGYVVYLGGSPYKSQDCRMMDSAFVAEDFESLRELLKDKLKTPGE